MKKLIAAMIIAAVVTAPVTSNVIKPKGIYSHMAMVTKVKYCKRKRVYKITAEDVADRRWQWYDEDGDWIYGDFAAFTMYNNGTKETVYDDIILDARYVGHVSQFERR